MKLEYEDLEKMSKYELNNLGITKRHSTKLNKPNMYRIDRNWLDFEKGDNILVSVVKNNKKFIFNSKEKNFMEVKK